jgi:NADPH-dependent curcumin reductase CurA
MVETMQRIALASVPRGMPAESDFAFEDVPVPECPDGGLLVHTRWLSVDPYLRGRMTGVRTYIDPIHVGNAMESGAIGEVLVSDHPMFHPGEMVVGTWAWQEFAALSGKGLLKLDPSIAPVTTALGVLGMPGMTAYFGLLEICAPKAAETVVVSGAAGAVGSAAGQIAKILGCRVVGIAGSAEKCEYLRTLGFDSALNYRTDTPYGEKLAELCPHGIDCYFDNVGGDMTDAVLTRMNTYGRVSVCGQIAAYNDHSRDIGPRPFRYILLKQLRAEGFIVTRWMNRWPEAQARMAEWLREGRLTYRETVYEGLASAPRAFIGLFHGDNIGKALVKL